MKRVLTVLGTRPELTKLSPVIELADQAFHHVLVHTGQHYSDNMDAVFYEQLNIRRPDHGLTVGSGPHGAQTGRILEKLESVLFEHRPDAVAVLGDTNSTLAGALCAAKMNIPVVHLEAGCRSGNKAMPEEINRIVVDHISSLRLAPDAISLQNLIDEGIDTSTIQVTGSTATEACLRNVRLVNNEVLKANDLRRDQYGLLTVHRAENTDDPDVLRGVMEAVGKIATVRQIVFPIHPRTKKLCDAYNIRLHSGVIVLPPQGYLEFLALLSNASFVLTDSGGVQEEAAALSVPGLVLRKETEWRHLIEIGKNVLVGNSFDSIIAKALPIAADDDRLAAMRGIDFQPDVGASAKVVRAIERL